MIKTSHWTGLIPQNFSNDLRNGSTHKLCTIYSDVCFHSSLPCFSTAILFVYAASPDDELIFLLLADRIAKTAGIAPVFNNTHFPTPTFC